MKLRKFWSWGGGVGGEGGTPGSAAVYLYLHFIPGFVSDFTEGGVRRNSGGCGRGESGETDSRPGQETK